MGFAEGLKVGGGLVSQALENERLDAVNKRQEEEFGWKRSDRAQLEKDRAAAEEGWQGVQLARAGVSGDTAGQIRNQYNLSNEQMLRAAKMEGGLPERLKTLDRYNWDGTERAPGEAAKPLPGDGDGAAAVPVTGPPTAPGLDAQPTTAPATGLTVGGAAPAPVRTAADIKFTPAGARDEERALGDLAVKTRDAAGLRTSRTAERSESEREILGVASKMNKADRTKYLEENVNMAGGMPIAVAEDGKGGYQVVAYDKNGKGRSFLMSDAQATQLVASHMMGQNNLAPEGLKLAGSINKEMNDLVQHYNTGLNQNVTTSNTARKNANSDEQDRARTGIAAGHLALARNKAELDKMGSAETFLDPKTGETYKTYMQTGKNGPEQVAYKLGTNGVGSLQRVDKLPGGLQHVGGKAGAGGTEKELPGEDTIIKGPNGETYKYSPQGYKMDIKAPKVGDRTAVLQKAGLPPAIAESAQWSNDGPLAGRIVQLNGKFYDVAEPEALAKMVKDSAAQARNESKTDQLAKVYEGNRFAYEHPEEARRRELERQSYPDYLSNTEGGLFAIGTGR